MHQIHTVVQDRAVWDGRCDFLLVRGGTGVSVLPVYYVRIELSDFLRKPVHRTRNSNNASPRWGLELLRVVADLARTVGCTVPNFDCYALTPSEGTEHGS